MGFKLVTEGEYRKNVLVDIEDRKVRLCLRYESKTSQDQRELLKPEEARRVANALLGAAEEAEAS